MISIFIDAYFADFGGIFRALRLGMNGVEQRDNGVLYIIWQVGSSRLENHIDSFDNATTELTGWGMNGVATAANDEDNTA
jgi:hypothetical protein